jgi:hypothetical protein
MALHSKRIDYTVYPPHFKPGEGSFEEYGTATRARLAAKKFGVGARLRRNVYLLGKDRIEGDWWVERVWEWNGRDFVDITKNTSKGLP